MKNAGRGGTITLGAKVLQILDGAIITASTTGTAQVGKSISVSQISLLYRVKIVMVFPAILEQSQLEPVKGVH